MLRTQRLFLLAILALALALPALGNVPGSPRGSLRGALRALERRRRAPPGPVYPLASFQYPERALEYLASRGEYQADEPPMDPMEREQALRKAAVFGYFEPSEDYPSEELALNAYKGTSFRERSGQLKEHHKGIAERKRSSPFRERGGKHSLQSEHLKELFLNDLAEEEENQLESDAEYVELLKELWDKYKYTHAETPYKETSEDLIRMYNKDIKIRKRQVPGEYQPSGGWGPIAFKKKRSSNQRLDNGDTPNDFLYSLKFVSQSDPSAVENLKDEKVIDEEEDPDVSKMMLNREQAPRYSPFETVASPADMREEYMLALQPLNNPQSGDDIPEDENNYDYESAKEKRFPVSKRSGFSKPIFLNHQVLEKRNLRGDKKNLFRSSGTDPRVIKELSSIFGEKEYDTKEEIFKKPVVKRSQIADETSHEVNPPMVSVLSHHHYNDSHENHTHEHEHDHEHGDGHVGEDGHDHEHHDLNHPRHEHENKPPLLRGPEEGSDHSHEHEDHKEMTFKEDEKSHLTVDHPIILKKKSVDWSNYFGFDKRKKKSVNNNMDLNYLRNLYLRNAKKHLNEHSPNSIDLLEEPLEDSSNINDRPGNLFEAKRTPKQLEQIKLDSMDNKLKNMESIIVDEALQYSGTDDGLDTKEEQENKEKILSRLAAAYSLEKMRKALKEFKISLQAQRNAMKEIPPIEYDEDKEKRTSEQDKKNKSSGDSHIEDIPKSAVENAIRDKIDADFESEQGAGHFLNGPIEPMSEGYMGGSGMKNKPQHNEGSEGGHCPVLDSIVRRCHSVDILAGDHGQLFLSLCSLHQICYLCGPSSPTGCDLIFLSEADSVCGGRAPCQQAARAALMSLREEHDSLADDLDGECERGSCLYQAIENQSGWPHPFKR